MAGLRKFFGGVISGGLVAGLTLVVVSQVSQPRVAPGAMPALQTSGDGGVRPADALIADAGADATQAQVPAGAAEPAGVTDEQAVAEVPEVGPEAATEQAPEPAAEPLPAAELKPAAEPAPAEAKPVPATDATNVLPPPPAAPQIEVPAQSVPPETNDSATALTGEPGGLVAETPGPLALPLADGAPDGAELPPPPPLTPEEAASLAEPAGLDDPARLVVPAPDVVADAGPDVAAVGADAPAALTTEPPPVTPAQADLEPVLPESPVPESPVPESPVPESPVPESPVIDAPDPATDPVIVPEAEPIRPADETPAIVTPDAAPATLAPDAGILAQAPSTLPATPRLITAGEGALTDRDTGDDTPAPDQPVSDVPALPEVALDDGPALERFATAFANADGKPLFGILLIDSGDPTLDRQAVAALPFPVSLVIDPLSPDAAANAALYRAGGKEVVMLATGIPDGATPADVEQTFQAHAAALPAAVAVIDSSEAAFQNNRPLSSQIVPILSAQGRGLLTWDRGLNAADQVARRAGLPTATIFRQIDAEGESIPVMRRYLDRAAFKAAQEGHAIVIGTLRAETVAALLEWTIEGRASTVALAPASALLRAN